MVTVDIMLYVYGTLPVMLSDKPVMKQNNINDNFRKLILYVFIG